MLYKGSQKIRDTGSYGVYHGSDPIRVIYHGSEKVYLYHRTFTWQAGTTFAEYTVPNYVSKIKVDCVASKGNDGNRTGGAGGASSSHYSAWERGANGGQGAKVEGTIEITNGTSYTIVVGEGGIGHRIVDGSGSNTGTDGGDSTAFGNTAGGGKGSGSHTGWYDYGSSWGGDGGTATAVEGFLGTNGAYRSTDSVYLTYGGGGLGNNSVAENGQGGYVRLDIISDSSDYTYTVDDLTAKIYEKNDVWKAFNI